MRTPILTIVGRPNVGKSTLFNRLIGERRALVHDMPGVTRDRNYGRAEWYGHAFSVVDTGGFDPTSEEGMLPLMRAQAKIAVDEADAILFVTDGREGLTAADEEIFLILRAAPRPVFVVVNKIDGKQQYAEALQMHALGVEHVWPVSAEHGAGISDLMEAVVEALPVFDEEAEEAGRVRIAVVGRPNAGKSTLINRLLGTERLIASEVPGTTRDSIDTNLDWTTPGGEARRYTLIDTAGIRRRGKITLAVETFGAIKAVQSIDRCHVCVLLVDGTEGFTDQDARIANLAVDRGRALLIVINKWDAVEKDHRTVDVFTKDLRERMTSLAFAPLVFISALTGQRAAKVLELSDRAHGGWQRRVPTAELNRWFEEIVRRHPPPLHKKRAVKLYYFTQARVGPPTFVGQTNMLDGITPSFQRYLENQLRETFDFEGTPLRLLFRKHGEKKK